VLSGCAGYIPLFNKCASVGLATLYIPVCVMKEKKKEKRKDRERRVVVVGGGIVP